MVIKTNILKSNNSVYNIKLILMRIILLHFLQVIFDFDHPIFKFSLASSLKNHLNNQT